MPTSPPDEHDSEHGVFYVGVAQLPTEFDVVREWVDVVVSQHPHMLHMRALIDCSYLRYLGGDEIPPSVSYLRELASVLRPLMLRAPGTRCAILVRSQALLWRARLFESITSASRIQFRAFEREADAFAWLNEPAEVLSSAG